VIRWTWRQNYAQIIVESEWPPEILARGLVLSAGVAR
jgi:hypothetical protein